MWPVILHFNLSSLVAVNVIKKLICVFSTIFMYAKSDCNVITCDTAVSYIVEASILSKRNIFTKYRMVGNFRGVQIFMDFVRSAYSQKITEF